MILAFLIMAFGIDNSEEAIPVVKEVSQEKNNRSSTPQKPDPNKRDPSIIHVEQPDIGPITVKGGLGDKFQYINEQAKKEGYIFSGRKLESNTFEMECKFVKGTVISDLFAAATRQECTRMLLFYKEDPASVQEAFEIIKDHLPTNAELYEEYSKDDSTYIYELKEKTFGKKYFKYFEYFSKEEGTFHIIFKIKENKVFAAVVDIGPFTD